MSTKKLYISAKILIITQQVDKLIVLSILKLK